MEKKKKKGDFFSDYLPGTQRLMQGDQHGRAGQDIANRRWLLAGMKNPNPLPTPGIIPGAYSIPGVDGDQVWNTLNPPQGFFNPAYEVYDQEYQEHGTYWCGVILAKWDTLEPFKFIPLYNKKKDGTWDYDNPNYISMPDITKSPVQTTQYRTEQDSGTNCPPSEDNPPCWIGVLGKYWNYDKQYWDYLYDGIIEGNKYTEASANDFPCGWECVPFYCGPDSFWGDRYIHFWYSSKCNALQHINYFYKSYSDSGFYLIVKEFNIYDSMQTGSIDEVDNVLGIEFADGWSLDNQEVSETGTIDIGGYTLTYGYNAPATRSSITTKPVCTGEWSQIVSPWDGSASGNIIELWEADIYYKSDIDDDKMVHQKNNEAMFALAAYSNIIDIGSKKYPGYGWDFDYRYVKLSYIMLSGIKSKNNETQPVIKDYELDPEQWGNHWFKENNDKTIEGSPQEARWYDYEWMILVRDK